MAGRRNIVATSTLKNNGAASVRAGWFPPQAGSSNSKPSASLKIYREPLLVTPMRWTAAR